MRYDILYGFDDRYAPHAGVSITSLLANNPDADFRIICAGMKLSEENTKRLEATVSGQGNEFLRLPTEKAKRHIESGATAEWNGSRAMWLKIFCLFDLPEDTEKVLYIDSDTIVTGDITGIWGIDTDQKPLLMAYDSLGNTRGKKQFGIKEYFNSGVILYGAEAWRDPEFQKLLLAYYKEHVGTYHDPDQAFLNDFFRGEIGVLPLRYNMQGFLKLFDEKNYLSVYNDFPFYSAEEIKEAKEHPAICHFFRVFGKYPWEKGNRHPYRTLYETWKQKSLWRDERPD